VLTIPSDLTSGINYWLGVIIDEDDRIAEMVEWNNATYLPMRSN
jgi:subtilase family serine protease